MTKVELITCTALISFIAGMLLMAVCYGHTDAWWGILTCIVFAVITAVLPKEKEA